MKKTNKKGFTMVELVIVIAVIAILAGVLIPTFTGIINRANESAALQEATNKYKEVLALPAYNGNLDLVDGENTPDLYIKVERSGDTYYYQVVNGKISLCASAPTITDATTEASGYNSLGGDNANVFVFTAQLPANEPAGPEESGESVSSGDE